jgi:hypothetical protein
MVDAPVPFNPAINDLTRENKIQILLAAYQKHTNALEAIEQSQEKLDSLLLGIYSAGLTVIAAWAKDAKTILAGPSPLAWALIVLALLVVIYGLYMSVHRGGARRTSREALTRVEQALAFYASGAYLQSTSLYQTNFLNFPKKTFLNLSVAIVVLVGLAFALGVYLIAAF